MTQQISVQKAKHKFNITINEDLTGTINDQPAHFDPKYNAMVLESGFLIDEKQQAIFTPDGLEATAIRLDSKTIEKIKTINEEFKTNYETHHKEQRAYTPKTVRLVKDKFVYTNPFDMVVTTSEVVEKLNLLIYKCDTSLTEKIIALQNEDGEIEIRDLMKLEEYKSYIKELKKYDKLRQAYAKKKEKYEEAIAGKTAVGMNHCQSCDNYIIVGTPEGKFLPKTVFFDARNEWLDSPSVNPHADFCLGVTKSFYYLKVSNLEKCHLCEA